MVSSSFKGLSPLTINQMPGQSLLYPDSLCKCALICPSHTHTVGIPLTLEFCLSKTRSKRSLSHTHTAERVGWWVWFSLQSRKKGKALHPIWGPHSWTCSSVTTGYTRRCVCKAVKERRGRKEVSRRNLPFCLSACTNTSSIFYWCDASIFFLHSYQIPDIMCSYPDHMPEHWETFLTVETVSLKSPVSVSWLMKPNSSARFPLTQNSASRLWITSFECISAQKTVH